jgi:hypothetical protein
MIDPITALAGIQSAVALIKKVSKTVDDVASLGPVLGKYFDAKSNATKAAVDAKASGKKSNMAVAIEIELALHQAEQFEKQLQLLFMQTGKIDVWNKIKARSQAMDVEAARDARKEKDRTLRAKYGITIEDWQRMFREQGECCAICKSKSPNHGSGQFVVDHDHEFGNIRGILCGKCNVMLGQANDDHGILFDAAMYLIKTFSPESIEERKTRLRAALDATIS